MRKIFRLSLCLVPFFARFLLCAEDRGPQTVEELRRTIEKALEQSGTPGAAVAVVSRDKVEWMAGLGWADEAARKPVTTRTLFRIGSVAKGFVALAALKLQEEGRLTLLDTLQQWVPEFPVDNAWESTDPVRLDQLLEHTSGIPDLRFSEYAHNDPTPITLAQALNFAPQHRVVRWRPGSRYAYSGVGIALAAAIIEKASGQRFEDYVRDKFFVPLGMRTASYFFTPEVEANITTMYWSRTHQVAPYRHLLFRPAGSVNASIEDMSNYVRFLLQRGRFDGQQLLRPASMDRLETPATSPAARAGAKVGYALCSWSLYTAGYKWHGHDGNTDACFASMEYCPELGVGFVVMLNSNQGGALVGITRRLKQYLMRDAPKKVFPPTAPMPAFLTRDFAGVYRNIARRDEGFADFREGLRSLRKIEIDDHGIAMSRMASRWVPVSGNLFRQEDAMEPELAVVTGEDGEMLLQCYDGTFRRTSKAGMAAIKNGIQLSFLILLSSVFFAPIWGIRLAIGRLKNAGPLGPRAWPLLGVAGIAGFIAFYVICQEGHIGIVGTRNVWTVGLMLGTLLIPTGGILAAMGLWRHRRTPINRFAYWHTVLVTLALLFITVCALDWGLIGIRTWV